METTKKNEESENIFLFVPNLIGYGRIFLALLSFWFMPTNYVAASWCYLLSGFLDAFDGHAARALNQSTKFGAMLDMLTDRCATMCLLATLSTFYPNWLFFFQLSMTIGKKCLRRLLVKKKEWSLFKNIIPPFIVASFIRVVGKNTTSGKVCTLPNLRIL